MNELQKLKESLQKAGEEIDVYISNLDKMWQFHDTKTGADIVRSILIKYGLMKKKGV